MKLTRRRTPEPSKPDYLQHVTAATTALARAQQYRDEALVAARRQHRLADIAAAAGLSLSRVKQIVAPFDRAGTTMAKLPPITEADLSLMPDRGLHEGDRVLALKDVVAFDLQEHTFDSERTFLEADPARMDSTRPDIAWELYDLDPTERWVAVYVRDTREIYAFRHVDGANETEGWESSKGSNSGPCILLGHLPTDRIVDVAVNKPATNVVQGRLGGLAWLYGRIRITNAIAHAAIDPSRDFIRGSDGIPHLSIAWTYFSELPGWERP